MVLKQLRLVFKDTGASTQYFRADVSFNGIMKALGLSNKSQILAFDPMNTQFKYPSFVKVFPQQQYLINRDVNDAFL